MKLYRREFVRHLRRQVKREVKARPEWRREKRRLPGRWRRQRRIEAFRWVVPLFLLGLVAIPSSGHLLWVILTVLAIGMTLNRTVQIQQLCAGVGNDGVRTFVQFPVSTRQVWGYIASRVIRSSLWWLVDMLMVLSFLAIRTGASVGGWLAVVPLAVLAWASVLATAVVLYWKFPRGAFPWTRVILWMTVILAGYTSEATGLMRPENLEGLHRVVIWMAPVGWALQIAEWCFGARHDFPVVAAGLLAAIVAYAVPCWRAVSERFLFWQPDEKPYSQLPEEYREVSELAAVRESRASEIEEQVRQGGFLRPSLRDRRGWLDRLILRFSPREEVVADYLLGNSAPWSRAYGMGVFTILLAPLLANLAGLLAASWRPWVLGMALLIGLARTTPIFGGQWPGFALGPMRPRYVAFLALVPVGLWDLRQCYLRINGLRFLVALPCWIAAGFCVSYTLVDSPLTGVRYALCVWLGLLLFQPYFFVFKISAGTNDTSGCLNALLILFFAGLPCGAAVAIYLTMLFSKAWFWQLAAFTILGLTTFGFEWIYRRLYRSQRFDLLARPRERPV